MRIEAADGYREEWLRLRAALWPDASPDEHSAEIAAMAGVDAAFVAVTDDGAVVGLAEATLRHDYVNGCDTSPVAFFEGLYVDPGHRRRGVARALAVAVEAWARALGCTELASDADLANTASHALHAAIGFAETERVVFFRKRL